MFYVLFFFLNTELKFSFKPPTYLRCMKPFLKMQMLSSAQAWSSPQSVCGGHRTPFSVHPSQPSQMPWWFLGMLLGGNKKTHCNTRRTTKAKKLLPRKAPSLVAGLFHDAVGGHSGLGILQVQLDPVAHQRDARGHWDPLTLIPCCYTIESAAKIRLYPEV